MGFGSATAFYFARGHNDSSLCGGPASLCRLVDSLQDPGYPFPTRGRWVGVARSHVTKLLVAFSPLGTSAGVACLPR